MARFRWRSGEKGQKGKRATASWICLKIWNQTGIIEFTRNSIFTLFTFYIHSYHLKCCTIQLNLFISNSGASWCPVLTWMPSKWDFLETKKDWNERICARLSLWNQLNFAIALYIVDQWVDSRNKGVPSFDNLFRHLPHSLFYKIICKIKTYQFYMVDEKGDIWMWEHAAVLHEMGSHKCLAVGPRTLWQGCRNTDVLSEPLFKSQWWALTFPFTRDLRL